MPERAGRNIDIPHMFLTKLTQVDGLPDFTISLDGAFSATKHLDAWLEEAGIKGCVLYLTAQLIPAEDFFGPLHGEETEELDDDRSAA